MLIELRPDKKLLDPKFNGYKLSLDPIPVYHQSITEGVDHVTQSEDQYSFIHSKVYSLHNHLFSDIWNDDTVFLIDKVWKVLKTTVDPDSGRLAELEVVWTIPHLNLRQAGHFNCSIAFPTRQKAMVADGCGRLYILNRPDSGQWQLELDYDVEGCENGCVLMSACVDADSKIHCVLMTLTILSTEDVPRSVSPTNKPKPATVNTVLHWLTFTQDGKKCSIERLEGSGSVDYIAIEPSCRALYVASNAKFKFTTASSCPLEEKMDLDEEKLKYTWKQTEEDVKIMIKVDNKVTRNDVDVEIKGSDIKICCQQQTVVSGCLSHSVDTDLTTWTLQPQLLEVIVVKQNVGEMWAEIISGDKSCEQILDPEVVEAVHSRLSHLCSDTEVQEVGESYAPTFNLDQLEECDSAPEESCSLLRLDAESHSISHQISLTGHQWLMSIMQDPDRPPCVCVRHDVDGCVWQLESPSNSSDWPCQHIGTFCALGYVAASKQQKKFVLGAPDLSYAVICEAANHVFVYYKSCTINGELRNRKNSSAIITVAKQQLINLHSQLPILGAHATNKNIFVLTADTLYLYQIQ